MVLLSLSRRRSGRASPLPHVPCTFLLPLPRPLSISPPTPCPFSITFPASSLRGSFIVEVEGEGNGSVEGAVSALEEARRRRLAAIRSSSRILFLSISFSRCTDSSSAFCFSTSSSREEPPVKIELVGDAAGC